MKKSDNLVLYFAAIFAVLLCYVYAVVQMGGQSNVLLVAAAGLAVAALGLAGSDLLLARRNDK